MLIAGIWVASGTPPTKHGGRVVFLSLDDAQKAVAAASSHNLFRTRVLLMAGRIRCTGPRGISVTGDMAWDLEDIGEPI